MTGLESEAAIKVMALRQRLGCWLHERWRTELVLRFPRLTRRLGWSWLDLCNRNEHLSVDAISGGRVCEWEDSSSLTVARVFPGCANRLLQHVLHQFPVGFETSARELRAETPEISILVPIGGSDRLPQFHLTLASARAQTGVACEVIVVEQSEAPTLPDSLPESVRYLHQPLGQGECFNKSRALNAAARVARGENLIILDADMLLPRRFASECVRVLRSADAVRPARLIFYLDRQSTEGLAEHRSSNEVDCIEEVVANAPNPMAVRRSTYWEVGGHDESYMGWGGEDSEFLDRLRTRRMAEGGWMPVLHAWHAPAPKKVDGDRNRKLHDAKMSISAAARINRLLDAASEPVGRGVEGHASMDLKDPSTA